MPANIARQCHLISLNVCICTWCVHLCVCPGVCMSVGVSVCACVRECVHACNMCVCVC